MLTPCLLAALTALTALLTLPVEAGSRTDGSLASGDAPGEHWGWPGVGACSRYCRCYMASNGGSYNLRRADCVGKGLIGMNLGLPTDTEVADFSNNIISELHNGCFQELGLIQLRELTLSQNAIHAVHPWAFAGLRRLRYLDLSHNHLQSLYLNTFAANRGLKTLLLAGNNLARVPYDQPLLAAPRLQVLDLSDCKLAHLGSPFFTELPSLASLNLSANNLIQLQPQVLARQRQLELLDLTRNPLACDVNTRQQLRLLEAPDDGQGVQDHNVTVLHPCPNPAPQLPASKHLARLLADVVPAQTQGPAAPELQDMMEPVGHRQDQDYVPRRTHESMILAENFEEEPEESDDEETGREKTNTDSENSVRVPGRDCPPLFPNRTSKNPIIFQEWFDPIPSFWATIFGGWVGFVIGLVSSACACHLSFWRAMCSGSTFNTWNGSRNRRRLSLELSHPDYWCEQGLRRSTSMPLMLPIESSCSSLARAETPPPSYNDLARSGFCPS